MLLAFTLLWSVGESEAKVIFVNANTAQTTAMDGFAWDSSFSSIAPALASAAAGDEIWVAAGVYPQTKAIELTNGIALYGGFAGTEAHLNQRNWSANKTILAGAQKASVVKITQGDANTRVDGFIITGGKASNGGGVYCSGKGQPTIANNRIYGNLAGGGAGISCMSSSAIITNNIIAGNGTNVAAGAFTYSNREWVAGGGIFTSYGSPTIIDNLISGNNATTGGGVYINGGTGTSTLANNVISGNSTAIEGGGVAMSGQGLIVGNKIFKNRIVESRNTLLFGGAGISLYGATNSVLANNLVHENSLPVGSKMKGSGVKIDANCVVKLVNNTFLNNFGGTGGSIVFAPTNANSGSAIANNLIAFNESGIEMSDNILFGNNCVFANGTNDFIGLFPPIGFHGNISSDPMLVQRSYAMAAFLSLSSPCRNAGNNDLVLSNYTDVFNHVRISDDQVDIGAQEIEADDTLSQVNIVRVSLIGNDANDGGSWQTAKRSIQSAIDSLKAVGGEVWVKEGTYAEKIFLNMFVELYGGFSGNEISRDRRNWLRHATILDGQKTGTVVNVFGVGSFSALDGFTICNGDGGMGYGGGILVDCCSPYIAHNLISNNVAFSGGGISINNDSMAVVEGNRIVKNAALRPPGKPPAGSISSRGGGIHIFANPASPNVVVRNNMIADNIANGAGLPVRGGEGGGVFYCGNGQVLNNTFLRNASLYEGTNSSASNNGGPLYWEYGKRLSVPNAILNNVFSEMNVGIVIGVMQTNALVIGHNIFSGTNAALFVTPASYFNASSNVIADPMLSEIDGMPIPLPGSPCIDAGDNSVASANDADLAGNPRISGGTVDIGAIEYRNSELRIQSIQATPEGMLRCELSGLGDADSILQSTSDFVQWDSIGTNRSATILVPIGDLSKASQRFFRVIQYR
jgi:hypothetical protein